MELSARRGPAVDGHLSRRRVLELAVIGTVAILAPGVVARPTAAAVVGSPARGNALRSGHACIVRTLVSRFNDAVAASDVRQAELAREAIASVMEVEVALAGLGATTGRTSA